ncbi:tetratricopeptide repeat-containing diguanylate cyclase [Pseudoalteromonas sp. MMG007]|uniref:tetratricopeptide repeat-containing diguanylate cyclase n=3 Tax=unclassified Pseudoalteromonas TaxID=194690 RepID=UPI001B3994E4|nr:tetratricopeptide repeat-containing diguanylate cyclase [Pseudoalteromonas sp. MMG007]MBQ4857762.1 GGDEF domain-containing protein [Pseudoalteromonas sp. MMG007]
MIKQNNNSHVKLFNRTLIKLLVLPLFLFVSTFALANDTSLNSTLNKLDFKTTQSLVNNIRANKLDYLINQQKLTQAFEISKERNWSTLHLEAAALYAELLFRQEEYDALNTHISNYINNKKVLKQNDIYMLFLEAQLKYLSQTKKLTQAKDLAIHLEEKIAQHSSKEKIIILRALAYYYTDTDSLRKTLSAALAGLELAMKDDDMASQAYFLRKVADAYNFLNDRGVNDGKAVYYAKKAVEAYEKTNDGLFTAKAYWSLGSVLLETNNPQDALIYLNKALHYFKKVSMKKGLAFAQYSIANIQYKQGNYDTAITLANENIELARAAGIHDMHLASMILLADIYIKQNLLDKANQINDKVFLNIDKFSRSIYKAEFLGKRYELKRQLNYIDDAFEAIGSKLIYTKKHYEATSESNIKTLQVKFEVKEKEDKILQLEYEKNINELQVKEEHQQKIIWRLSASIAFILVIVSLFLFYRQIRQRKKYHTIALTDYLTNSLNRRGVMQIADNLLANKPASIAIVDLDYFKNINDQFGHDTGDLVLIKFAQAAKNTLGENDTFGRYGGEEWLFVLDTLDKQEISNTFENLALILSEYCREIEALPSKINITFSVGVAISNTHSKSLDALIKHADQQLYKAKENGRNQIAIA